MAGKFCTRCRPPLPTPSRSRFERVRPRSNRSGTTRARAWSIDDGWKGKGMECGWHRKSAGGRRKFFFVLVFLISLGSWKGSLKARAKVSLRSGARAENKNVVDPRFMGAAKTLTKSDACSIPLSYVAICAHRSRSIEMVSRSCVSRVQQFAAERSVASHGHAWMHIRTVLARVLNSPAH